MTHIMGERLGPLPVWAWAGLGVGAVFAWQAIRRPAPAQPAAAPAGTAVDLAGAGLSFASGPLPPGPAGGYTSTDVLQAASEQWQRALESVLAAQQPPAAEPAPQQQPPAAPPAPAGATPGADWARFNSNVMAGLQLSREWFKATTPAQREQIHQQAAQFYQAAAAAIGGRYEYLPGSGVTHIYDASGQLVFST